MNNKVFFIGDLHLDHKRILEFSSQWRVGSNVEEHNEWIVSQWNSVVTKRDMVYVMGDVVFSKEALTKYVSRLNGMKNLVRGNHDKLSTQTYLEYFNNVFGILKYDRFWLSHAPVHPQELRGCKNIHGHVHHNSVPDDRYINVSVENLNGIPISLDQIVEKYGR